MLYIQNEYLMHLFDMLLYVKPASDVGLSIRNIYVIPLPILIFKASKKPFNLTYPAVTLFSK